MFAVALYARAWIEMPCFCPISTAISCRPLREGVDRNLIINVHPQLNPVALYARAWIEIPGTINPSSSNAVALYARAWIEIL